MIMVLSVVMLRRAYVIILLLYAVHFYYVHIAYTCYPESLKTFRHRLNTTVYCSHLFLFTYTNPRAYDHVHYSLFFYFKER